MRARARRVSFMQLDDIRGNSRKVVIRKSERERASETKRDIQHRQGKNIHAGCTNWRYTTSYNRGEL
jgi:hypothetical protein